MAEEEFHKFNNEVLNDTTLKLSHELKERIRASDGDDDAVKATILDLLSETTGISEDDWNLLLDGNILAFKVERNMGMPFDASVNACMYTNFLLGYFMAKSLQDLTSDTDTIPADWDK